MTRRPACGEQDPKLSDSDPEKAEPVNKAVAFAPRMQPLSQNVISNYITDIDEARHHTL